MKRSAVLVFALAVVLPLGHVQRADGRQSAGPSWNAPAPELTLELLNAPTGATATLAALKGQAVVLEFWATWCSGCVAQIPHLNELTEKFKDKPVRFISVTDEDERSVVSAFLVKRPIMGWVALDARGTTFKRYGIIGRPYTALIDANGILRALVPPTEVQESTIEELLRGTLQMKQPPSSGTPLIGTEAKSPLPLLQTIVRPAMPASEVGMSPGAARRIGNRWEMWGMNVRSLLASSYPFAPQRIILADGTPTGRYDVSLVLPDDSAVSRSAIIRQLVQSAFQLNVRQETREMPVIVLRTAADGPKFKPLAKGQKVSSVVSLTEAALNAIVIDETGLSGTYDFAMAYPKDEAALRASVQELGLTLTPERRPLEVLIAEPVKR